MPLKQTFESHFILSLTKCSLFLSFRYISLRCMHIGKWIVVGNFLFKPFPTNDYSTVDSIDSIYYEQLLLLPQCLQNVSARGCIIMHL